VDIYCGNIFGRASVPSGASTGLYECVEIRDGTKNFMGLGVTNALNNIIKIIGPKIIGLDVCDQKKIDNIMITIDGTDNKSRLGTNAILAVSLAVAKCSSVVKNCELYETLGTKTIIPIPLSNFINGGKHSGSQLNIQEFLVIPSKVKNFSEATMALSETYHELKSIIQSKYGKNAVNVGDEGGFVPPVSKPSEALELISRAIEERGYQKELFLGLDSAASEFYNWKLQQYNIENKRFLEKSQMIDFYKELIGTYPIISIEDPFDQDDFESFKQLTAETKVQIVGDDLLVTNPARIKNAIENKLCNSILIKPNQIGTLTETFEAINITMKNKLNGIISHRSGETEDTFISDLAVGLGVGQIKLGAPARGERTTKFNRLLRIEEKLGKKAKYGIERL
jgi:enolase